MERTGGMGMLGSALASCVPDGDSEMVSVRPKRSVRFSTDGSEAAGRCCVGSLLPCSGTCTMARGSHASRAMEYQWAGRGLLPPEMAAASQLALAFGPELEEDDHEASAAAAQARIQVGDALVSLLERHRSYRWGPCMRARTLLRLCCGCLEHRQAAC